jgi:alpha-galactosidase
MVSWVTQRLKHQPIPLDFEFDVSMAGVLGIGYDITKWTPGDLEIAKKKVAQYKIIRPLVQQGVVSRLVNPFETNRCAFQYTHADANSSALICYNMAEYLAGSQFITRGSSTLKLKSLKPGVMYRVQKIEDAGTTTGTSYRGDFLMNIGIGWPVKGPNKSQVLLINAVSAK